MKAVVLHEYGDVDQLRYEEEDLPEVGANEVRVRVHATSINPIDWKLRSGSYKDRFPLDLPEILGRDLAGEVDEAGSAVTGFPKGHARDGARQWNLRRVHDREGRCARGRSRTRSALSRPAPCRSCF